MEEEKNDKNLKKNINEEIKDIFKKNNVMKAIITLLMYLIFFAFQFILKIPIFCNFEKSNDQTKKHSFLVNLIITLILIFITVKICLKP